MPLLIFTCTCVCEAVGYDGILYNVHPNDQTAYRSYRTKPFDDDKTHAIFQGTVRNSAA